MNSWVKMPSRMVINHPLNHRNPDSSRGYYHDAAYSDPPPPTPTVVEAARVAAEMMGEKPAMTREDYLELGKQIARLNLFYKVCGWVEE